MPSHPSLFVAAHFAVLLVQVLVSLWFDRRIRRLNQEGRDLQTEFAASLRDHLADDAAALAKLRAMRAEAVLAVSLGGHEQPTGKS